MMPDMRRIATALFTLLGLLLISTTAHAQFERNWEFSENVNSVPSYLADARALAYGTVADGNGNQVERVLVSTSTDGFSVEILDASDGTNLGNLDVSGITDVSRDIQDIAVTSDGVIIGCNEVNNNFLTGSNETFKCYRWDDLQDSPTEVISFDPPDQDGGGQNDWIGRLIGVEGAASDNSLTITTAASNLQGGTPDNVYRFTTSDNGQSFSVTTVDRTGDETTQGLNAVTPLGTGASQFIYNPAAGLPKLYSADGTFQEQVPSGVVSSFTHAAEYFEVGSNQFFATLNWEGGGTGQRATIVDVTNGFSSALPYGSTPSMGSGSNNGNGTGDVALRDNGDGTVTVFALATNTGIGSYTTTDGPLPVELASLNARSDGNNVRLTWTTASETNNTGFYVQRAIGTESFTDVGFREGAGTTTESKTYAFRDGNVPFRAETIRYRLRQVDSDGTSNFSRIVTVERGTDRLQLLGSAPNPVASQATIRYAVPEQTDVRVAVYDMLGREVTVLQNGPQRGRQTIQVNTTGWASGTYLLRLEAGSETRTSRMTVVN
jgi:hypothetical protein